MIMSVCCEQLAHHLDHVVQVVLDDVVLAFVLGRDRGGDDPLGDLVHIVRRDHERIDDVGDRIVHALDQLVPAAQEQLGIGPLVELARLPPP